MMFSVRISSTAALVYELCLSKVHYEKKERKKTKMASLADFFLASRVLAGTFEGYSDGLCCVSLSVAVCQAFKAVSGYK